MEEKIKITRAEYMHLLRAKEELRCLKKHNVVDWNGYEFAMEDYVDPIERLAKLEEAKLLLRHLQDFIQCEVDPAGPGTGVNSFFDEGAEGLIANVLDGVRSHKLVKDIVGEKTSND